MSPRPPCTFSVATAVIVIAVGNIIIAEASPFVPTEVIQNLRQVSEAIQELTGAIAGHQSCKFVQTIAESLQSQQPVLAQLLSKSVGNQNPQCQAPNYDLVFSMGELKADLKHVSQAVGAAVDRVASLDERLKLVEAIASQDKIQRQTLEEAVTGLDDRLQKVETLASLTHKLSQDMEEKLQAHVETEDASNKGSCRSPFYKVGDDCLFVQSDVQHTWDDARKFCRSFGGDLVVPSDVLMLRELLTNFRDRNFWIGGVDIGDNNKWQWLNGSPVDLSVGWSRNQPDNLKGENCIHYWYTKNWFLNDSRCSGKMNFVCQDAVHAL
ncbi:uncharacterized protein LOC143024680 isoform X1 [Oratosquilla oratoria]|uniref:uncharacterized protein LOC143024680 isoform X1 n=1 Tax=Oratosquilla oratoria TaxID=337810 RepID=UPI003F774AC8